MARAYAPGNISCVFKIIPHPDATRMHSLGMGFTVTEGVEVTVSDCHKTEVLFNGEGIHFPTVLAVVERLIQNTRVTGIRVDLTSPLPLGCGFGLSGAAALATAYALNERLQPTQRHRIACDDRTCRGGRKSHRTRRCLLTISRGLPRQIEGRRAFGC